MTKRLPGRQSLPVAIGQRFGRLTVLRRGPNFRSGGKRWWCECDCGRACALVGTSNLRNGRAQSCGCLRLERCVEAVAKHGLHKTPEYKAWENMKTRCTNPRTKYFANYGGRGIGFDEAWQDFEVFLRDMGPRPGRGYSLERLDVDGNYGPGNCVWATKQDQCRNKRESIWIECQGLKLHLVEWSKRTGISEEVLRRRYHQGASPEQILLKPVALVVRNGKIAHDGKELTLPEWALEVGIQYATLYSRYIKQEWTIERALTTPVRRKKARSSPGLIA